MDRTVHLGSGRTLAYDYLVIATGTTPRPDQTPGMLGPEWRRSIFDFYTLDGRRGAGGGVRGVRPRAAGRAHRRDADQVPGRAAGVHLPRRGLAPRARASATASSWCYVTPLDGAFTQPVASAHLGHMLEERKVDVVTDFMVESIDPDRKVLVSYDEREVPFDLLVTVPVNMGADFVARSGLGDELKYVPVDKHTLLRTRRTTTSSRSATPATSRRRRPARWRTSRSRSSSQLPRARRRPTDDRVLRRPRQLLRRGRATTRHC